jgi:hypothetical protein
MSNFYDAVVKPMALERIAKEGPVQAVPRAAPVPQRAAPQPTAVKRPTNMEVVRNEHDEIIEVIEHRAPLRYAVTRGDNRRVTGLRQLGDD